MEEEDACSLLIKSISFGRIDVLRSILYELSNTKQLQEVLDKQCTEHGTLLHYAVKQANADAVRTLCSAGANPNLANRNGENAIGLSVSDSIRNVFEQELFQAVAQSKVVRVSQLLASGLAADAVDGHATKNTLLHWGATYGNPDMISILCEAGAQVNAANVGGDTPLHDAVRRGDKEVILKLLEFGAYPNFPNAKSETAFSIAQKKENHSILQTLSLYTTLAASAIARRASAESMQSLGNGTITTSQQKWCAEVVQQQNHISKAAVSEQPSVCSIQGQAAINGDIGKDSHVTVEDMQRKFQESSKTLVSKLADHTVALFPLPQKVQPITARSEDMTSTRYDVICVLIGHERQRHGGEVEQMLRHAWNRKLLSSKGIKVEFLYGSLDSQNSQNTVYVSCVVNANIFARVEEYKLQLSSEKSGRICRVVAASIAGLCCAISTFVQILLHNNSMVPLLVSSEANKHHQAITTNALKIHDWPRHRYRALIVDCGFDVCVSAENLCDQIERLTFSKMNTLFLRFHSSDFANFNLPFSAEDIQRISEACQRFSVALAPSLTLDAVILNSFSALEVLNYLLLITRAFPVLNLVHFSPSASQWILTQIATGATVVSEWIRQFPVAFLSVENQRKPGLTSFDVSSLPNVVFIYSCPLSEATTKSVTGSIEPFGIEVIYWPEQSNCQAPLTIVELLRVFKDTLNHSEPLAVFVNSCYHDHNPSSRTTICKMLSSPALIWPVWLSVLSMAWNSSFEADEEFIFEHLPWLATLNYTGDFKLAPVWHQFLALGQIERSLDDLVSSSSLDDDDRGECILQQLLLAPDDLSLNGLSAASFKRTRIDLNKCQQHLEKLKQGLPYDFELALVLAEAELVLDSLSWAARLGQALCIIGRNPKHDSGLSLVNLGVANLHLTMKTDLVNKLIEIRRKLQHIWLSRHIPSSLNSALNFFDNLINKLLPSAKAMLSESGELLELVDQ